MEELKNIPKEKFEFADRSDMSHDKKFDTKPIGYFKDAFLRFCKNKASVVAAIIIFAIILYAIITPLCGIPEFIDTTYAKMGPRNLVLREIGIATGGSSDNYNERYMIYHYALGVAAEDAEGTGATWQEGVESYYQPVLSMKEKQGRGNNVTYDASVDTYLDVGFRYRSISQSEYNSIREWEEQSGIKVLYPLIDEKSGYYVAPADQNITANYWYKMSSKWQPVNVVNGKAEEISLDDLLSGDAQLEENYLRDESGNPVYYQYTGGGTSETAQYRVRVLYYNYYVYQHGFEPQYLFGTDSQGYDLSLRMARGVQLSLLIAVCVSVINLVLGAIYGAIEGYYGGAVDLVMERIADILSGVPFIVVATLFQIHLAAQVGAIPSLLFAFVLTGWISTAARTRTQFYRFKNSEYVLAARTLGARDRRIIWKHIFPNSLGTIITSSILIIPSVIFSESMLSFLGIVNFGSSTMTSLGTLLSDAASIWTRYPHLMVFPAIIISLLMICFNLFGNGLRDAFNPSLRGVEE